MQPDVTYTVTEVAFEEVGILSVFVGDRHVGYVCSADVADVVRVGDLWVVPDLEASENAGEPITYGLSDVLLEKAKAFLE